MWEDYKKPDESELQKDLSEISFRVTQENRTEKPGDSPLDKNCESGIYVEILYGAALKFIPKEEMEKSGYGVF